MPEFINPYDPTKWFNSAPNNQIYHLVYMTTNLINGRFYIGKHSTYKLKDGYLGSGNFIKIAIKNHKKKNFRRDILAFCLSESDAFLYEKSIVTETFIKNRMVYNQCIGGNHGSSYCGQQNPASATNLSKEKREIMYMRMVESKQKTSPLIIAISPQKDRFECRYEFTKFCRERDLSWTNMYYYINKGVITNKRLRKNMSVKYLNTIGWEVIKE